MDKKISESQFNMWRACIAIIHVDQDVAKEEKEWILKRLGSIPFTVDQKNILQNDLANGLDIDDVLPKINEKNDLAFLLGQHRIIAGLDGRFSDEEKEVFKKIEEKIVTTIGPEDQNLEIIKDDDSEKIFADIVDRFSRYNGKI